MRMMNKNIQVVVFDTRPINGWLRQWLGRFKHVWFTSQLDLPGFGGLDFLAVKRNKVIKKFLADTRLPWLLVLDDDLIPLDDLAGCPNTWPLVESDKDVASAHFVAQAGNEAHGRRGDFAFAAGKISRNALKKIGPPWSHFDFSDDEDKMRRCECDYFAGKAQMAGFCPVKVGAVGHSAMAALVPLPDAERLAEMKKPEAARVMCRVKLFSQLRYEASKKEAEQ